MANTERERRQAALDAKVMAAAAADIGLSGICKELERLQGWNGSSFLTDGDSDTGVLAVTKKEFRENIDTALAAVVKALGMVRLVKVIRQNVADLVRNMTDEEYDQ